MSFNEVHPGTCKFNKNKCTGSKASDRKAGNEPFKVREPLNTSSNRADISQSNTRTANDTDKDEHEYKGCACEAGDNVAGSQNQTANNRNNTRAIFVLQTSGKDH